MEGGAPASETLERGSHAYDGATATEEKEESEDAGKDRQKSQEITRD